MDLVIAQQFVQHLRGVRIGDLVTGMHAVVHQRVVLPGVHRARQLGSGGIVAHPQLGIGEGQRVIDGGDTGSGVTLVGLRAGEIEGEMHAWTRLNFLLQRVAMQVDHARHQGVAAQVDFLRTFAAGRVDGDDTAVRDQHGGVLQGLALQHDLRAREVIVGVHATSFSGSTIATGGDSSMTSSASRFTRSGWWKMASMAMPVSFNVSM